LKPVLFLPMNSLPCEILTSDDAHSNSGLSFECLWFLLFIVFSTDNIKADIWRSRLWRSEIRKIIWYMNQKCGCGDNDEIHMSVETWDSFFLPIWLPFRTEFEDVTDMPDSSSQTH
jgi:hypothetical protein